MLKAILRQPRKRILKTRYISIDVRKCRGCGKCIAECPNDVLAKVNFFLHNHVHLNNPQNCTGCLACKIACFHQAIT
ncbi:4Fe-4S dicluster domain-containing protein [Desulforamulus aquiferis]|uniref:4Fe-4S dicluster domain-containing protein n=1 Tax=Desulforamulus aquiferis TaxID=1397668 RepID=UPI00357157A1